MKSEKRKAQREKWLENGFCANCGKNPPVARATLCANCLGKFKCSCCGETEFLFLVIKKNDVLCKNCHKGKLLNDGICPHKSSENQLIGKLKSAIKNQ